MGSLPESGGSTSSFTNTPQAKDDLFLSSLTKLTEDNLKIVYLDVMANDLGGNAKTLFSIDNGLTGGSATTQSDLYTKDIARTESLSTDTSLNGAKIWITADGKVGYDASTLSVGFRAQLDALQAGSPPLTDTFTYAIRLGNANADNFLS